MAQEHTEKAVEVESLVVEFSGVKVLDQLNLDVRTGEVFGLVGGSGSGKSVLLRAILGLVAKRAGRVSVFGVDQDTATEADIRTLERRWGVLYQDGALFSALTAFENIEFPMREYLKLSPRLMREIATVKLEMMGLKAEDGLKYPSQLSGGMAKRVALARALALDPAIVFLDEPTSGLDPIAAREFGVLIRTLQRTLGLTVFMVTHNIDDLRNVCDRIAVLAEGKIIAIGSLPQVLALDQPYLKAFFQGVPDSPARAPAKP